MATQPDREARYREAERALWSHFGVEPRERWVEADARRTRIRFLEHGAGRPVVFVHGTPTAGGVWVPLVAALQGVRAVVVDRPGCALSDPIDDPDLTPERLREANAAGMAAVVESLGEGPVDVVGNSAGGMAAAMFAARRPDLVRSVVFEGVPAFRGMHLPGPMRAAAFAPIARLVVRHRLRESDLRRSFTMIGHGDLVREGRISREEYAWRESLANDTDTYANELALLRAATGWRGPRAEWLVGKREVAILTMPSLWLIGDRDPFASPAQVRRWARHAPQSTFRELPGSGHQPWLDDPAAHAARLTEFWNAAGAGRYAAATAASAL